MKKISVILFLCFFSVQSFAQWKSYYPESKTNKKEAEKKNKEKNKHMFDSQQMACHWGSYFVPQNGLPWVAAARQMTATMVRVQHWPISPWTVCCGPDIQRD